ncbi:HIT family protein [Halobacteriales archaeon QS_9_67_15]|nr:MAG: HIT family protein [Halobacteriales archaeon QS_9_67_15]
MSDDCIFCSIVAGEIPSRTVYEDDDVSAFLDANPLAPGHTLVIPKAHHEHVQDVPNDLASDVFSVMHRLVEPAESAVDADGSTVAFNNGEAAGQEVPHVHGHIVPRFDDDGGGPIHSIFGARPDLDDDELDDIAASVSDGADD